MAASGIITRRGRAHETGLGQTLAGEACSSGMHKKGAYLSEGSSKLGPAQQKAPPTTRSHAKAHASKPGTGTVHTWHTPSIASKKDTYDDDAANLVRNKSYSFLHNRACSLAICVPSS